MVKENKILFINSCIRKDSRTAVLSKAVLSSLKGEIQEVCLIKENITPITEAQLQFRLKSTAGGNYSAPVFRYAKQFADCDEIVIAAPYWDLCFPALLKLYLEAICVCGLTFFYGSNGSPNSLCKAKRLIYVTTSGGFIGTHNFGFEYIKALAETFFGIEENLFFCAEGLDITGNNPEQILKEAQDKILCELT